MQSTTWKQLADQHLGVRLGEYQQLGGGDFAQSYRTTVEEVLSPGALSENFSVLLDGISAQFDQADAAHHCVLNVGDDIFIKTHKSPPPLHFTTEARGLCWLKQTNTVRVPDVLGANDDAPFLAMRWVETGTGDSRSRRGEIELGAQLAALHQATCNQFGRTDERTTGSLGLPNKVCETWSEFYATQRLIPLKEIAASRQALPVSVLEKIEQLSFRLDEYASIGSKPSLLHGDLWAGNRLVDSNGLSWVIDPACHGGHREFDLAMMRLFGGFDADCLAAYEEVWPLAEGWQERVHLHQLAPLIVHAIKFGAPYRQATEDAVSRYL